MPQLIGAFFVLLVVVWVVAAIVWVVQWIMACFVFVWDIFLMPLFVYFTPGLIASIIVIGVYIGSTISVRNYFSMMNKNIVSEDILGQLIRYYLMSFLVLFLFIIYSTFTVSFGIIIFDSGVVFIQSVQAHYESIRFPAFHIHFPFWE